MTPPATNPTYDVEEPQDYVERKPFRWGRFLLLSFLLLVTIVIAGHWWWSRRAASALAAQMAEYARRGEPTTIADFTDAGIPDAMNAAVDLRAAAAAIAMTDSEKSSFESVKRFLPLTQAEVELLDQLLGPRQEVFTHMELAKTKPHINWGLQIQTPLLMTMLPDVSPQRDLAHFLAAAALLAHQRGDHDAAIRHIQSLLFLSRAMLEQPFLISHLVSMRIAAMATDILRQIAPDLRISDTPSGAAPAATTVDRKRVQALIAELLDEAPTRDAFRRAMYAERLAEVDITRVLTEGDRQLVRGAMGGGGGGGGGGMAPSGMVAVTILLRPLIYEDGVMMVRHTTAIADAAREQTLPAARAKIPPFPVQLGPGLLHLNASLFMPSLNNAVERHYATLLDRRATAAILAIRLYAIDHDGALPQRLEDLVPDYLPQVPIDCFSPGAEPIRYRPGSDPILYGLGANGVDDGGSALDSRGQPTEDPSHGIDIVFHLKRQPRPVE